MNVERHHWRNQSVAALAGTADPVAVMLEKASTVALNAMQEGWSGPPFDPFRLAEILKIGLVPNGDVLDARTVPLKNGRVQIEYNPNRPRARIRYSVAHEVAHTFFPDCADRVRYRAKKTNYVSDDWELELLCNIGAAELLMPTGCLADLKDRPISIQAVLELRRRFEVSTESILLRLIRATEQPYTLFAASRAGSTSSRYEVDYSLISRSGSCRLMKGFLIPEGSIVNTCTAMGFTAVGEEHWPQLGSVRVECVGVAPHSDSVFPRVIGILRTASNFAQSTGKLRFVSGDATEPLAGGMRILAHIVNDATPNWGAGFGRAVQRKWPEVQQRFRNAWNTESCKALGQVFFSDIEPDLILCQMICQRGYGVSDRPRVRYAALRDCLLRLRDTAAANRASVHMPRIGTGEAGGSWALISALIDEILCAAGISVTVYDLPQGRKNRPAQGGLFDRE